jgi:hypothetical protein
MNHQFEPIQSIGNAEDMYQAFQATGYTKIITKKHFFSLEPLLQSRMLRAAQEQTSDKPCFLLRDPIEDDPSMAETVQWARTTAEREFPEKGFGRGRAIWELQADLLLKKHNIVWFSVEKLNQWILLD